MALFFDPSLGRVSQFIPRGELATAMLTFPGFDYASLQLITSGLSLSLKPVWQANDTLGDDVYLVSFGETITPLPLSGLVFAAACDVNGSTGRDGLKLLIEWWQERNLLNNREPVSLTIGSDYAVKAFISDLNISVANAEDNIWKFDMLLLRIPQRVLRSEEFADQEAPRIQQLVNPTLGPDSGVPVVNPFPIVMTMPLNTGDPLQVIQAASLASGGMQGGFSWNPVRPNFPVFEANTDGSPVGTGTVLHNPHIGYDPPQQLVGHITLK